MTVLQKISSGKNALFDIVWIAMLAILLGLNSESLNFLAFRTSFFADFDGFCEAVKMPGGFLTYVANGLMCCGYFPCLAIAIFTILSFVSVKILQRLTERKNWVPTVIPFLFVGQLLLLGRNIWGIKIVAFLFLNWFSILFFAFSFYLTKKNKFITVLVPFFFPLVGMPAIYGGIIVSLIFAIKKSYLLFVVSLISTVLTFPICKIFYNDISYWNLVSANNLFFFEPNAFFWNSFSALAVFAVFFPQLKPVKCVIATLTFYVAMTCLIFASDNSADLRPVLQAEVALHKNDFSKILEISKMENPPRIVLDYRIAALFKFGKLPDELFDVPCLTRTTFPIQDFIEFNISTLFYQYGLLNSARKYCFENAIATGWTPYHYLTLAKIAIIQKEDALAKRYIFQLQRFPFFADWAEKLSNPQTYPSDIKEVSRIYSSLLADTGFPEIIAGNNLSDLIYGRYAYLKTGSVDMIHLYFASSMLVGQSNALFDNLPVLLNLYKGVKFPKYYQQALLFYLSKNPQANIPAEIFSAEEIQYFSNYRQQKGMLSPAVEKLFLLQFSNSFHFYDEFVQ